MKNENKINFFIVFLSIVLVIGILFFILKDNFKTNYIQKLTINELKEKIDNKDSFILVVTQDNCSHCKAYIPTLNKVAKEYNITFYDISLTNLNEDEKTYLKNIANTSGTPTTVFIEDGEEKTTTNRLVGSVQEYRVIEKLKAMGYIKDDK